MYDTISDVADNKYVREGLGFITGDDDASNELLDDVSSIADNPVVREATKDVVDFFEDIF